MSDRELLELAAKASGELTPSWYGNDAYFEGVLSRWNPLEDDGDALRLAVKLGIELAFTRNKICAGRHSTTSYLTWVNENRKVEDPYAATRRAIVRAAAEVGRNMK